MRITTYPVRLLLIATFGLAWPPAAARAALVTLIPNQDTFAWAADPDSTYGAAGALSVAGDTAVNGDNEPQGIFDTWLKFNAASAVSQFDAMFGAGNWTLLSARLSLQEVAAPNNPIFNRGIGQFDITWIANDDWSEGPGSPGDAEPATGNQIGYNYGLSILNSANDELLGIHQNAGTSTRQNFGLALSGGFRTDLLAAGVVSLYLSAVESGVGFTFNSSTTPVQNRPQLILEAVPEPGTALLLGTSLFLLRRRRYR